MGEACIPCGVWVDPRSQDGLSEGGAAALGAALDTHRFNAFALEALKVEAAAAAMHSRDEAAASAALDRVRSLIGDRPAAPGAARPLSVRQLPMTVPLAALASHPELAFVTGPRGKDHSEDQARKDIERDSIRVNGKLIMGGSGAGFNGVLNAVERAGAVALESCGLPPLPRAERRKSALLVLRRVNRTESAAVAFHALRVLLAAEGWEGVNVVPDSAKAEPLEVVASVGGFWPSGESSPPAWGLRFRVGGTMVFRIVGAADAGEGAAAGEVPEALRVTYRSDVCYAMDPGGAQLDGDAPDRGESPLDAELHLS